MSKALKITSNARTHCGNKRASNQDAFLCQPEIGLWIVADGMGGHHNGEYASQLLTEEIKLPQQLKSTEEIIHYLKLLIEKKNFELYHYAKGIDSSTKCGSTIVCLLIKANKAIVLWVGDSRLYLTHKRSNKTYCLTEDHTVYNEMFKSGKMDEFHPMADKYKEVLARVVGGEEQLKISEKRFILTGDERFLLCSDGLTKELVDEDISGIMQQLYSPGVICEQLIQSSLSNKGRDNITTCVVDVELV